MKLYKSAFIPFDYESPLSPTHPSYFMSNKDYFGQPQQQYYPPAGAVISKCRLIRSKMSLTTIRVCRSTARSGWVLPSATTTGVPGLRWSAWLSTPAAGSASLRVRLMFLPGAEVLTLRFVVCSQQAPQQQKSGDFCTACLTGVCLCCCAEGGWPCGLRPRHMLTTTLRHRHTRRQNFAPAFSDLSKRVVSCRVVALDIDDFLYVQ